MPSVERKLLAEIDSFIFKLKISEVIWLESYIKKIRWCFMIFCAQNSAFSIESKFLISNSFTSRSISITIFNLFASFGTLFNFLIPIFVHLCSKIFVCRYFKASLKINYKRAAANLFVFLYRWKKMFESICWRT